MARFPLSLGLLPSAAAFYALQTIPTLGTILLLVGGIFWAGLMVNAAFLGTVVEVFVRKLSKFWLLLPLCWFGTYAAHAWVERQEVATLGKEFAVANLKVKVGFDPARLALVESGNGNGGALVQDFGLPVYYSVSQQGDRLDYRATRLAEMAYCRTIWNDTDVWAVDFRTSGFSDAVEGRLIGNPEVRFCIISGPEAPGVPQIRLTTRELPPNPNLPVVKATETVIETPDGQKQVLRGGHAEVLPWFPFPVAGCIGAFASDKQGCMISFFRSEWIPIVDRGSQYGSDAFELAAALGLKPVPRAQRAASDSELFKFRIAARQELQLQSDLDQLQQVFANPFAKIDSIPFRTLSKRPDRIAPLAPEIARAFARTIGKDYRGQDNGRNLSRMLADLPQREFEAVRHTIEDAYRADTSPWLKYGTRRLQARLAGRSTEGLD